MTISMKAQYNPMTTLDPEFLVGLRDQFPVLQERVRGRPLVYLDNAATSQKPWSVLRAMQMYYQHDNANIRRGAHKLAERATESYENAREGLRKFINAASTQEIVFTKGCTEAVNLVASSWGRAFLNQGDLVIASHMEHHANLVPWQMICRDRGANFEPIPIHDEGTLDLEGFQTLLERGPKMVAIGHVSNALGTIHPIKEIVAMAHAAGAKVFVDGAQSLAHLEVDVRALDADFYSMSSHKMYGPTGTGALYARQELLESMPPFQYGGEMIRSVSFEETTYNDLPYRFEPGTPNMAGVIGWGAAIEWLSALPREEIRAHEDDLLHYATEQLSTVPGLRIVGTAPQKASIISFIMDGAHPHDIGTILDQQAVAIRTGHHCCMPLMKRLKLPATARASFALYNTREDADALVKALGRVTELFG